MTRVETDKPDSDRSNHTRRNLVIMLLDCVIRMNTSWSRCMRNFEWYQVEHRINFLQQIDPMSDEGSVGILWDLWALDFVNWTYNRQTECSEKSWITEILHGKICVPAWSLKFWKKQRDRENDLEELTMMITQTMVTRTWFFEWPRIWVSKPWTWKSLLKDQIKDQTKVSKFGPCPYTYVLYLMRRCLVKNILPRGWVVSTRPINVCSKERTLLKYSHG